MYPKKVPCKCGKHLLPIFYTNGEYQDIIPLCPECPTQIPTIGKIDDFQISPSRLLLSTKNNVFITEITTIQ